MITFLVMFAVGALCFFVSLLGDRLPKRVTFVLFLIGACFIIIGFWGSVVAAFDAFNIGG